MSSGHSKVKEKSLAEKRVNLAIELADVCVNICTSAVRERYPTANEKELLALVRERIMYGRRRRHEV